MGTDAGRADVTMRLSTALARLRRKLPLAKPVRVHLTDSVPGGDWGQATESQRRFIIYLDERAIFPDGDCDFLVELLIHEWAHLMTWGMLDDKDYDAHWGLAYARAYRAVYGGH